MLNLVCGSKHGSNKCDDVSIYLHLYKMVLYSVLTPYLVLMLKNQLLPQRYN